MSFITTFPAVCIALLLTGCLSTGSAPTPSPEQGAVAVRITVSSAATLSLSKNPHYIPAAEALVTGIDALAGANTTLTPELIARFVAGVCARKGLSAADSVVFTSLAQTIYVAYASTYRPVVVSTADPTVKLYIAAFREGLADALAVIASQPARPANS